MKNIILLQYFPFNSHILKLFYFISLSIFVKECLKNELGEKFCVVIPIYYPDIFLKLKFMHFFLFQNVQIRYQLSLKLSTVIVFQSHNTVLQNGAVNFTEI